MIFQLMAELQPPSSERSDPTSPQYGNLHKGRSRLFMSLIAAGFLASGACTLSTATSENTNQNRAAAGIGTASLLLAAFGAKRVIWPPRNNT